MKVKSQIPNPKSDAPSLRSSYGETRGGQKSQIRIGVSEANFVGLRASDFLPRVKALGVNLISGFGFPILGVAFFALLAGCAVGPNYKRPEATTIPAAYTGATNIVETDTTNIWNVASPRAQFPKGAWWEIFGDPDLNALEAQASVANQQLKVAVARLDEARAQMNVARAGLFPNVSASGSFVRQRVSPNTPLTSSGKAIGTTATFDDFYAPLTVGYELDLWGRVRRSVESARTQVQASADDLETIRLMIQAEAAVDYFSLRALDSQKAVLASSVDVFAKSLELTRNLRAGGAVSDLDVAQAQTVLKTTQAQLPSVVLQRTQFEHALAVLVGQPASSFHIAERPLRIAPPLIPAEVPSQLLERRPDIAAAERRMASANAGIGVAKAAFFPSVQLNGLAGFESLSAGTLFNWSSRLWALGPSISVPIFEGGKLRAGLQLANASYVEMVATYRQTVLTAFSEVEDSLAAQTLLANQYAAESDALAAARKQLEIVNNQYRDGLITYLEVATAESTELNVEFTATQLRGEQLVAAVTLVKALGGGWQESAAAIAARPARSLPGGS
ncbi:MAG TPA: efflux transporter outer membrane subunit [Verrucomicrobiae bacterium]|nr:efflux transporter outer membrane subunit [Verrucomicrobiae bacterium]